MLFLVTPVLFAPGSGPNPLSTLCLICCTVGAGYFFTYYNTRITEERKAQIERVNEQVNTWTHLPALLRLP